MSDSDSDSNRPTKMETDSDDHKAEEEAPKTPKKGNKQKGNDNKTPGKDNKTPGKDNKKTPNKNDTKTPNKDGKKEKGDDKKTPNKKENGNDKKTPNKDSKENGDDKKTPKSEKRKADDDKGNSAKKQKGEDSKKGKKEKKEKNEKKEKTVEEVTEPVYVSPIAKPLAGAKLTAEIIKLVTAAHEKKEAVVGVRQTVKHLKKDLEKDKSLVIFGADVSPIDVISHIPVTCEEKDVPYVFIPSRRDLGQAVEIKRPTSVVLITLKDKSESADDLKKILSQVKDLSTK